MYIYLPRRCFLVGILVIFLAHDFSNIKAHAGQKDSLQPAQGLTVFDGNGKRVGSVLAFFDEENSNAWGGAATIAFRIDRELVILYVRPEGFTGEETGFTKNRGVAFESSNCAGATYTNAPTILFPSLTPRHILHGTKLYGLEGSPKTAIVSSRENLPDHTCESFEPAENLRQPVRFLTDLADHFQPPFTLR